MSADFAQLQRDHHVHAKPAHYAWQTAGPYFAATEAALLSSVRAEAGERLLEMGCGEGGNLHHLRLRAHGARLYGVDFSAAKVEFARSATGAHTAAADAARLPFADGSFDAVLIRDLLHHLPDRAGALGEAHRVLKPGGRLTVVEPNRRAPLILLQAALVRAERGLLHSTAEQLRGELERAGFTILDSDERQPFPLARVVLHPSLRAAGLGALPSVARALSGLDALAGRLIPRRAWVYLVFTAVRA